MYKKTVPYIFAILTSLIISGCQIFDRQEDIPAWLIIDSVSVVDNPLVNAGALTEDIRDVWITVDDIRLGTFEMPTRIPVLEEGMHEIVISGGIIVSGISSLRTDYLYYEDDTFEIDLEQGGNYILEPVFRYKTTELQQIEVIEDFEDGENRMSATLPSDAKLERTSNPNLVKYGEGCGVMNFSDTTKIGTFRTNGKLILPQSGAAFLEMDILTDYSLTVGLYVNSLSTQSNGLDMVTFKPTDKKWKKFYVALDETLDEAYVLRNPESFYAYFRTEFGSSTLPREGVVLIDNVKVLFIK